MLGEGDAQYIKVDAVSYSVKLLSSPFLYKFS